MNLCTHTPSRIFIPAHRAAEATSSRTGESIALTHVQLQAQPEGHYTHMHMQARLSSMWDHEDTPPPEGHIRAHTYTCSHTSMSCSVPRAFCGNTCTVLSPRVGEWSPGAGHDTTWQLYMGRGGQAHAIWTLPPSPPSTKEAQSIRTRIPSNPLSPGANQGARRPPESSLSLY